jgi:hypothetical protein
LMTVRRGQREVWRMNCGIREELQIVGWGFGEVNKITFHFDLARNKTKSIIYTNFVPLAFQFITKVNEKKIIYGPYSFETFRVLSKDRHWYKSTALRINLTELKDTSQNITLTKFRHVQRYRLCWINCTWEGAGSCKSSTFDVVTRVWRWLDERSWFKVLNLRRGLHILAVIWISLCPLSAFLLLEGSHVGVRLARQSA